MQGALQVKIIILIIIFIVDKLGNKVNGDTFFLFLPVTASVAGGSIKVSCSGWICSKV